MPSIIASEPGDNDPTPPYKNSRAAKEHSRRNTSDTGSNHSSIGRNSSHGLKLFTTSDPDDLDSTQSHVRGSGILADRLTLTLSPSSFAENCKLLFAAARNDTDAVKAHLEKHPDQINFRDYDRRTALHVAASEGHLDLVKFLVEKGAHVNRSDRWGGSPLDDAYRHRHQQVAAFLRSKGAMTGNADQLTNLITAAADGDVDDVFYLIQNGEVDINAGDYDKRTALHLAAGEGHTLVCELLLRHGADPNSVDRWGSRPLDDAQRAQSQECIDLLEMYNAKPGVKEEVRRSGTQDDDNSNMSIGIGELEMIEKIGSGAFGVIYKCKWRGTLVAAKFLKTSKITGEFTDVERETALHDFRTEAKVLSRLRHPNICMLLAYSTTASHEVMVSELMKCSLLDMFKFNAIHPNSPANLTKRKQIIYAQQLAQGMNYLHNCKPPIIHRDLKPANLLIDFSGTLKISDFGLAKVRPDRARYETDQFCMTGETGSYRFMAPEVYRYEQYTETVDIYSYAMIFYYLLSGSPPWPTLNGIKAVQAAATEGRRPCIPRHWDQRLSSLLQQCWDENPSARPSFELILERLNKYSREVLRMSSNDIAMVNVQRKCCNIL